MKPVEYVNEYHFDFFAVNFENDELLIMSLTLN